jgi:hypothetical protein
MLSLVLAAMMTCAQGAAAPAVSSLTPSGLRCEYLVNPIGIDSPKPRLGWVLESSERGPRQMAYQIRVAANADALAQDGNVLWDSGQVKFTDQNQIAYGGPALQSHQECFWSVRVWDTADASSAWSAPAQWTMGIVKSEDWKARWITAPEGVAEATDKSGPLPIFRRDFRLSKEVGRALLYVCGLGFHEASINGKKVGDAVLEPGWTNYRKTCLYSTYDVTALLGDKDNTLGVMLGNGMYNVPGGRYVKFTGTFGPPKFFAHLHVEYADGDTEEVGTDESWRAAQGPIVFSCMYGGEDYDARNEQLGWDTPGFDAASWKAAAVSDGPGGKLSGATAPPIKVMQTFTPVKTTRLADGKYVYDLGQNFSGRPCIKVKGTAGATVKLIPGELMDEKGQASQRSSGGPMWFSYTLKGGGVEEWRPRFSYYGFRYVQVEGARPEGGAEDSKDLPEVVEIKGEFTHSSAEVVGEFECANPLLNKVHALILASIKSNLQSVLTDCPHREKLGWLEVSHLLADGLLYNFDLARFYAKIEQDMADSQIDNGLIPDIAPEYTVFSKGFRDSPEWGSAGVINPWNAWVMYGDRRNLETHFGVMLRYADYLQSTAKYQIVSHGLGDWYDIGPKGPGESQLTSKGLTSTAVYYQDLSILQQVASLLGKKDEAAAIAARVAKVREAFNTAFYHAKDKQYDRNSQTANAMPLILGLAEEKERGAVAANLTSEITAGKYHVTAGDVGFSYLVRALTEADQGDVLYKMLCQTDGPGYAYQIDHGATSLTEAWDTNPASSQNHCMLGHVEGWFYRGLAGIRADESAPGFRHFILRPQMPAGLDWVKAHYDSIRGRIASEWHVEKDGVTWSVQVPANTTATLYLPGAKADKVTEAGKPLAAAKGIDKVCAESGCVVLDAASGTYKFRWGK